MTHTKASPTARTSAHTLPSEHIRRMQFKLRVASKLRAIKESALAAEIQAQYAQEDGERLEHKLADIQCWLRERTASIHPLTRVEAASASARYDCAFQHSWSRMVTDTQSESDATSEARLLGYGVPQDAWRLLDR